MYGKMGDVGEKGAPGSSTDMCPCPDDMTFMHDGQEMRFPQGEMTHEQAQQGYVPNK